MNTDTCVTYVASLAAGSAGDTLRAWRSSRPTCGVLAIVTESEAPALPALQAAAREAGVPLVGGVFPAVLHQRRFVPTGAVLLRFDDAPPAGLVDLHGDAATAGDRLADAIEPHLVDDAVDTLLLFFDATVPSIASILDALYARLGSAVRYVGANAGSESFTPMPALFDAERVVGGAAAWMLVRGAAAPRVAHDYTAPAEPCLATATTGNRVAQIDFRPALDFYRERVRAQFGVELGTENFYGHAARYPLGILLANGQVIVRIPVALEEDGSIRCAGEIPPHAMLVVAESPARADERAARALGEHLGDGAASGARLLFYCAGRRLRQGDVADADLAALVDAAGHDVPVVGALSLGEIGSVDEGLYPLFHNGALACLGWPATR